MEANSEKEVGASAATDSPGREVGLYLYCFFLGDQTSLALVETGPGIDGAAAVMAVTDREVSLAASFISLEQFSQAALQENLKRLEWLAEKVRIHERVVEAIASHLPVAPIKFATIVDGRETALKVIESNYATLRPFLRQVKDKEEWGIKVYLEESKLAERSGEMSLTVKELDERIARASPGQAYMLKKQRESVVREEMGRLVENVALTVHEQLALVAARSRMTAVQEPAVTGRPQPMILNAAYLVERSAVEELKQEVDRLAERYHNIGLLFELTGPWPPHNFCPSLAQAE